MINYLGTVLQQEARVGKSVPRQALVDAIRDITSKMMSGETAPSATTLHIGLLPDDDNVATATLPDPKAGPRSATAIVEDAVTTMT